MKPKIILLSRPQFTERHNELLEYFMENEGGDWKESGQPTSAERLVEFSGRICYMSFGSKQSGKTNSEYIDNLIRSGHESVLEHAVWTMAILGVSRAFTHQLVRHRVGFSYSQLSQQYYDETNARFVLPAEIEETPEVEAIWRKITRDSVKVYRQIIGLLDSKGVNYSRAGKKERLRAIRSAARSVLPNATETAIVVTANARALRHFLILRGGIVGDSEMRIVSANLLELIKPEAPAMFPDFSIEVADDGLPLVVHHPAH